MTNNDDLALKLKAAAEVIATEHYTDDQWFHYLRLAHHSNILSLLAERDADKKLIAELDQRVLNYAGIATARAQHVFNLEKRIAELEQSEHQLIGERDDAEEALANMYQAATGERPEWSNWFSFADAVDAVEQRLGELEARTVSVKLQRVSTKRENWTTWDWIQHLGGRYQHGNPEDYIEFGSVYAVQQMLKQFARTAIAQAQDSFIEEIRSQLAAAGINLEVGE